MKIFTLVLLCLMLYIPSHAEDLDTVWTLKKSGIDYVKFSPDGSKVYGSHNNSITEIESSTGKILRSFDPVSFDLRPEYMEMTSDGKYVLTAGSSYNIYAWNTQTGKSLGELNYHDSIYNNCSFTIHPTEHKIYLGYDDTLMIYNIDSKKVEEVHIIPNLSTISLKASKDNKYIVALSSYFNNNIAGYQKKVQIIETKNFRVVRELNDNIQDLLSFDFSNDSKYLSYVSAEDLGWCVYVYNFETNTLNKYTSWHFKMSAYNAKFVGPNNLLLVSGTYEKYDVNHTLIYDFNNEKILYDIQYTGVYNCLDVNINNNIIIASIGLPRTLYYFNSRWFTTSVPSDPRFKMNGNMKITYMNEVLSLDNTDSELIKLISVFDINGKLIKSYYTGYSGATVELPFAAPAGVYLVRIVTDQSDYNFKFVRE